MKALVRTKITTVVLAIVMIASVAIPSVLKYQQDVREISQALDGIGPKFVPQYIARLRAQEAELVRLRGEVGALRAQLKVATGVAVADTSPSNLTRGQTNRSPELGGSGALRPLEAIGYERH